MEYYVVKFKKPSTKLSNCHKYAYVPKSWVLNYDDNRILFRYPAEKNSVTIKRIEEGEKLSAEWPMHYYPVIFSLQSVEEVKQCAKIMQASCRESLGTQHFPVDLDQPKSPEQQKQDNRNSKGDKKRAVSEDNSTDENAATKSDDSEPTNSKLKSKEAQSEYASIQALVKEIRRQNESFEKLKLELQESLNVCIANSAKLKKIQSEIRKGEKNCVDSNTVEEQDEQPPKRKANSIKRAKESDKVDEKPAQGADKVNSKKGPEWTLRYRDMEPGLEELVEVEESQVQKEEEVFPRKDSKWTVRYRDMAPGLEELVEGTGVYVDSRRLAHCKEMADDGLALASLLLVEIFSDEALATCYLTRNCANRAWQWKRTVNPYPNLDEPAMDVLLDFVEDYAHKKNWHGSKRRRNIIKNLEHKLSLMQNKRIKYFYSNRMKYPVYL